MVADSGLKAPRQKILVRGHRRPTLSAEVYTPDAINALHASMMSGRPLPPEFGEHWGVTSKLYVKDLSLSYYGPGPCASVTLALGDPCGTERIG